MKNLLWLSLIFCIVFLGSIELNLFGIDSLQRNDIKFEENEEKFELEDKLHTSTDFFSGIGKALNATEYGNGHFPNYFLNSTNNDEASIIVPDGWEANEIAGNIFQIYDYDSYFLNDTFDLEYDSNRWTNDTNSDYVSFGWYDAPSGTNDSIYMRFDESGSAWTNKYAYWNHTLSVPREYIDFENWEISFNYRALYTTAEWLPGASSTHNLGVYVDASSQEFTICKLEEGVNLQNNTWHSASFVFQPELYNFQLPGTISLIFLVDYKNSPANPTGYFEMYYDNVTLKLSTIPKPSQINLTINDITNDDLTIINDTGQYGEGIFNLQNNWKGGSGGLYHNFSFSHNSSGNVIISTDLYSYASSEKKTTTLLGLEGCDYVVENNSMVGWTAYFAVNRPGSYSTDYYFNITKPLNWVITAVIDPYLNNRVDDVLGTGYGNTTISIPSNIITNGAWKFVAEAPNYVTQANLFKKVGVNWERDNSFQVPEKIKINASIKTLDNPNIDQTNATLLIFLPNGTLWHQEKAQVDLSGMVEFKPITLGGLNTTIGQYTIQVSWNNNDFHMSQVGLTILNFEITKDSLLQRSNYHPSGRLIAYSGDHLLLKVNFTDLFTGEGLSDAVVNYTIDNTPKILGDMFYQGGGIYVADIETEGLQIGLYNVTVSAVKPFYSAQNNLELFKIEIQLYTTLLRRDSPTIVQFNDNATVKYSYKDSYGNGISGATISFNIDINYIMSITDFGDGNYTIVFNAAGYQSLGTQQFIANFSKIKYQTQINFLQFEIVEQDVNITVLCNSENLVQNFIEVQFNEQIHISVRVFAKVEEIYLSGGTVKLIIGTHSIDLFEDSNHWYNGSFIISPDMFLLDINYAYLKFELANYKTTTFSLQIKVRQIEINVNTINFIDSLSVDSGDRVSIRINLTEDGTNNPIENATIYCYWRHGTYYFSELGEGLYELEFDLLPNIVGNHLLNLVITSEEIIYKSTQYSFYLSIKEEQLPNYLTNIIVISLIGVAGVLGILSVRSYVILPRKRRRDLAITEKTQPYKDIRNVEAIICSSKSSGLSIYNKTFSIIDEDYITGFSGFIQAITILEKQYTKKGEKKVEIESILEESEGDEPEIKELDFNFFNSLICDYKNLRIILVLRELSSERLRNKIESLTLEIYSKCEDTITQFKGNLSGISQKVEGILFKHLPLYYKEEFVLNKSSHYQSIKVSGELSKLEIRILNILEAQSKFKPQFLLETTLSMIENVAEDKKIIAIESLIRQGLIKPAK